MDPGERTTGTRDEQYNLVSVLYHALQGAETIEAYTVDAEAAGDERLAAFFREAQATYRQLAERAKERLGVLEVPPEPGVTPDAPPEGGISPGDMAGGIPPQPTDVEPGRAVPPLDAATPVGTPPGTPDVSSVGGGAPNSALGDVPPRSADIQREPDVLADEVDVPIGEIPPTTDVPRPTPDAALPPDEDIAAEPGGVPSRDVIREPAADAETGVVPGQTPDAPLPGEKTPGEPGRATLGPEGSMRPEEQEEEKGLLDKAKDKLTEAKDRLTGEEEDRPPRR
jgi:hypothetical protein